MAASESHTHVGSSEPSQEQIGVGNIDGARDAVQARSKSAAPRMVEKSRTSFRILGYTLRDGCFAVGVTAILLGFGELLLIYNCPSKNKCRKVYRYLEYFEQYPESEIHGIVWDPPWSDERIKGRDGLCEIVVNLFFVSGSLFIGVTVAAGALLIVAVLKRKSLAALLSAIFFALAIFPIVAQTASEYMLAIVTFRDDIEARKSELALPLPDPAVVSPRVSLRAQKILVVVGGIGFALLYLAFAVFAIKIWRFGFNKPNRVNNNDNEGKNIEMR